MKNNLIYKSKPEMSPLIVGIVAVFSISILLYDMFHMFLISFFFFTFGELLIFSLKTDYYFFENYFLVKKFFGQPEQVNFDRVLRITLQKRGDIRFDNDSKLLFHLADGKKIKVVVEDDEKLITFLNYINNDLRIRIDVDSRNIAHKNLIFNEHLKKEDDLKD